MPTKFDEITKTFGELVFIGHKPRGRYYTTWYIKCEFCGKRHEFKKMGNKTWHTSCKESGIEWTITPAEYYVLKPCDFTQILGDL